MNILHYTLGFAPYRSGGLIRYARDLMIEQKGEGHQVAAFYPSDTNIFKKKCTVKFEKCMYGVHVYEMINPLPVPLLYGIHDTDSMMDEGGIDEAAYKRMLDEIMPVVLHVHTLMGLPKKYLQIAHERGIRIVYTTHDYFGLCPKVNLIDCNGTACYGGCNERCSLCNATAKPTWFLRIRNMKCLVPLKSIARRVKR